MADLLSSLFRTLPSLYYKFKGSKATPGEQQASALYGQQRGIADQMAALSQAYTNPNDPRFQRIYNEERGAKQQDLAQIIRELMAQNRTAKRLGRTSLGERGGENIFRSLMAQQGDVQSGARDAALKRFGVGIDALGNAGSMYGNAAAGYGGMAGAQQKRSDANRNDTLSGFGTLADIIRGF